MESSQKTTDEWLEIGIIVGAQGLKGQVRVKGTSDFPERFEIPGKRWLQSPKNTLPEEVELLQGYQVPGKNIYVINLKGVEDRTAAENLRGFKLLVSKSDRFPLEEDEYHVADLINLQVYNQQTGEIIGVVTDLYVAGNDLLKVKLFHAQTSSPEKSAIVLIPFVKDIVPVMDLQNNRLEINPPAGLLDIIQEE